jgi:protein phosphatase
VPVRVTCPHCQTPCLVAEQHVMVPVQCAKCGKTFTAQSAATAPAPAVPLVPPRTPVTVPRLDIGSATSAGRIRNRNEDSFLVQHFVWSTLDGLHEVALLTIADGIGGQQAGHEASSLVIHAVGAALGPLLAAAQTGELLGITPDILKGEVDGALKDANRQVHERSQRDTVAKGMGAAVVLALIWDGDVLIGHSGDCRAYLLRDRRLAQVTQDHTLVARMVQLGQLTPKEAEVHPRKNELTQAVGRSAELKPDLNHLQLTPGDSLVLACDGLHADVDERRLQLEMARPSASAAEFARKLVDLANDKGGSDNCTVITVGYR